MHITCNMGARDLPDMYVLRLQAYVCIRRPCYNYYMYLHHWKLYVVSFYVCYPLGISLLKQEATIFKITYSVFALRVRIYVLWVIVKIVTPCFNRLITATRKHFEVINCFIIVAKCTVADVVKIYGLNAETIPAQQWLKPQATRSLGISRGATCVAGIWNYKKVLAVFSRSSYICFIDWINLR